MALMNHFKGLFSKRRVYFILSILILSILVAITGYYYYKDAAEDLREEKEKDLQAIAELKINQLVEWKNERLSEAEFFATDPEFIQNITSLRNGKNIQQTRSYLRERLSHIKENHGYKNIFIVSPDKNQLFSLNREFDTMGPVTSDFIDSAKSKKKITFTDFHRCNSHKFIHLDFIAPVINEKEKVIAIAIFRIDPHSYLYPLIQSWPTPSKTAETILVHQKGDSVVFLNELRHRKNTAVNLSISLDKKNISAVQAVLGNTGIFQGRDYRGVKVLSDISPVPETGWFLLAEVDQREILSEIHTKGTYIGFFAVLLILLIVTAILLMYSYQRQNLYKKLWQSQEEFKATLDNIPDVIAIYDTNFRIRYINSATEKITGHPPDYFIGKYEQDLWPAEVSKKTMGIIEKAYKNRRTISEEVDISLPKTGLRNLLITCVPIFEKNNTVREIIAVTHDLTKWRQKEKEYKELLDGMNDAIFVQDFNGMFVEVNQTALQIYGYSKEELLSGGPEKISLHITKEENQYMLANIKQGDNEFRMFELQHKTKDGTVFPVEVSSSIITYQEKPAILSIVRDITKRKQSEKALKESETKFREIFNNANDAMYLHRLTEDGMPGQFVEVNAVACNMLGYTKEELLALSPMDIDTGSNVSDVPNVMKILNDKGFTQFEMQHTAKNGQIIPVEISSHIIELHGEQLVLSIARDITERKKNQQQLQLKNEELRAAEEELRTNLEELRDTNQQLQEQSRELEEAKEKAEESDRLKTAFLQNLSHEIRTPMNGILGFTDLLRDTDLTPERQNEFINIIQQSGNRMLNIIDELIRISRIEANDIQKNIKRVDINEELDNLYKFFKPDAENKDLTFTYEVGLTDDKRIILTDKDKLQTILSNIIKNAIKFTETGEIVFGYTYKEDMLEFYVKDTGIGIKHNQIDQIFNRFRQGDPTTSEPQEGTGLGLPISKAYVELLGGNIRVESETDSGSRFLFTIPFEQSQK